MWMNKEVTLSSEWKTSLSCASRERRRQSEIWTGMISGGQMDARVPPSDDGGCEGSHGEQVAGGEEDGVVRIEPHPDQVQEVDVYSRRVRLSQRRERVKKGVRRTDSSTCQTRSSGSSFACTSRSGWGGRRPIGRCCMKRDGEERVR